MFAKLFKTGNAKTGNAKKSDQDDEIGRLPECTNDEYFEFLACMRRGERRFQTAKRTLNDEYAAWLKDYRRRKAAWEKRAKRAPVQAAAEVTPQA